jgi:hypothetical protein
VIWEPVVATDTGPPSAAVTSGFADARAHRYWDPQLRLSQSMRSAHVEEPRCLGEEEEPVWDAVFLYPPGATWGTRAQFCGRPVVKVVDDVRARLTDSKTANRP